MNSDERQVGVTELLRRWREGEDEARDDLMTLVYPELHRLAAGYLRGERSGHTLQPTALVHEAYLRILGTDVEWQDRVHFLAVAARVMRRALVDYARARQTKKRGGDVVRVTWSDSALGTPGAAPEILDLDAALESLAQHDERKSRVVELHFFGGMTYEETAEVMDISVATVNRELRFAKAWLLDRMKTTPKTDDDARP